MTLTRRALTIALAAAILMPFHGTSTTAAPGQPVPQMAIELDVHLVAPDVLVVHVAYTCEASPGPVGYLSLTVTQSVPLAAAGVGDANLTCDGAGHEVDVNVFGGPVFAPGDALASGQACTVLVCGMDSRKVVIESSLPIAWPVP
jgi:hypothetical protein